MNIVHLIYAFTTGGAETMLIDIANEQVKTQNVSIVIINNIYDNELLSRLDSRIRVYKIDRRPGSKNPIPPLKLNVVLYKIKPDVIHSHSIKGIDVLFPYFRNRTGLTIHDTRIEIHNIDKYKTLYAISVSVQKDIEKRYAITPILVYNGIHTDRIKQKNIGESPNVFNLIQISRLEHYKKGQDLLLKALDIIVNKYGTKNIRLDFIGEGSSKSYLQELTRNLNLDANIRFLGLKDRAYIYDNLHQYDLLIQPSIYEGFGLTVTEAMAAGVPVLVSDIDGPMEIIRHGEYGYHFPSGDINALADSIINIMDNPDNAKTEAAYRYVLSHFSIKATAANYIEEYKKL
jgi:Glycosyltransferase